MTFGDYRVASTCGSCGNSYTRTNPRQIRCYDCIPDNNAKARFKKYRLTQLDWNRLYTSQDGCCAVCARDLSEVGERNIHVDHDHSCCPGRVTCGKCVRALVCVRCNAKLAVVEDAAWMVKATAYLKEHTK